MPTMQQLLRTVLKIVRRATHEARRSQKRARQGGAEGGAGYAGDYEGTPTISYEPVADDRPDPGEVVWAWVPYEEDHSQGKDRPVLVIGRDGDRLLALQMSSQDHDQDAEDEARWGRYWVDVGSGAWDGRGRDSEARVDRVLRLEPESIRRIGAVLGRERFDEVAEGVRKHT
ncbi:type II toxin-antitoxin system PemK/MazF family toxin [Ornithinimicrobium murale]|uniref:type II toxin-antitoxin system PemK/MazF family toxin n=1 Tax=Ornithinimicrobium murale TaxID=1050153 RepID=UPI000E0CEF7A|nr:type II toxin-antitoxin system PemK/MazF family toxin [Ornithinimicrobium murale]